MNNNAVKTEDKLARQALYRIIWRWHFYAGVLCIPIIITLSISGAIYLFKPQIDSWVDSAYLNLELSGEAATAKQQIAAALKAFPDATFKSYQLPENAHQAAIVQILNKGVKTQVYINPYNLHVIKSIAYDDQLTRLIRSFHGELLAGNSGSIIVELAACWAIVLIISGLYLWWPRNRNGIAGVLYPRLSRGGRVFWRDLHAVVGMWISAMVLFLLISGLPWALVWGSAFKQIRQWNSTQTVKQDWPISRSQERRDSLKKQTHGAVDLNPSVIATTKSLALAAPVILSKSRKHPNLWVAKSMHQNRPKRANAWLNANTGELVKFETFSQKKPIDRIIGIAIAAHEGQLFGWFNQLLGVVCALGLVLVSVSALILWQRRKPLGELGAPGSVPGTRVAKPVIAIIAIFALLLPLFAISLLAILLLESLVLRHFTASKKWLGLTGT